MQRMLRGSGLAIVVVMAGGCGGERATSGEAWSTKSTSVAVRSSSPESNSSLGLVAGQNLEDAAIGLLERAAESDSPLLRANAIEGLQPIPRLAESYARAGLVSENRGVRFVAAMTIGRLQLKDSSRLVEPLLHDPSDSVRAAAIYALRRCGQRVDLNPLAGFLSSRDPEVRANAAMVLGELGEPSAAPMLEQSLGRGAEMLSPAQARVVELQIAEALLKLGRTEPIHAVRAALFYPAEFSEATALACLVIGSVKDKGSTSSLYRLIEAQGPERRPAEVRLAAMLALAKMGEAVPESIVIEYVGNPAAAIRAQTAHVLGSIHTESSLGALQRLLADPDQVVQVAAASSVIRLIRRDVGAS